MNKVVIAFDIDGTLRDNTADQSKPPLANEAIRTLLITLSTFKNVKILVWSGGGEAYARDVVRALGLQKYVDHYAAKEVNRADPGGIKVHTDLQPDIAIDDIQDCQLGKINLIVREK